MKHIVFFFVLSSFFSLVSCRTKPKVSEEDFQKAVEYNNRALDLYVADQEKGGDSLTNARIVELYDSALFCDPSNLAAHSNKISFLTATDNLRQAYVQMKKRNRYCKHPFVFFETFLMGYIIHLTDLPEDPQTFYPLDQGKEK